ncbi:MAG: WD40 repeat domain-containing protein, partial [Egibacteraceae bacterium]
AVAAAPDGQVLSGGADGSVRVWDLATGKLIRALEGHSGPVWAVAAAPDGQVLSGGDDGSVRVWDLATGALRARLVGLPGGWAVLLPDGAYKLEGKPAGLWWAVGLCRFEPGELDPYVDHIRRLPAGELILDAR